MKIKVRLFGMIAEAAKSNEIELEDVVDTNELKKIIIKIIPRIVDMKFAVAINNKLETGNVQMSDKDEIDLLPPFAGG